LLAVIAFSLGTTVLIKMGRTRYLWVSLVPLGWLLAVTMTAGWLKIFSADPKLGFLSAAAGLREKIAVTADQAQIATLHSQLLNNQIDAAVTALFLLLVLLVVGSCGYAWWGLLTGRRERTLREAPYTPISLGGEIAAG
jgi:carbon starvation protein